jgi:hypothetical protein
MERIGRVCCVTALLCALVATHAVAAPSMSVRRNLVLDQGQVWPGDFNGDGITDLAGSSRPDPSGPPWVTVLLGRGDGSFGAPLRTNVVGEVYGVGDANNDGRLDVLVQQYPQPDEGLLVLRGNGDGTFSSQTRVTTATQSTFGILTDLDSDGNRDVIVGQVGEAGGDAVAVFFGHGDLTFDAAPVSLPAGFLPWSGIVSDLNGDGRRDLVVTHLEDNFLTVFRNDGNRKFSSAPVSTGYTVAGVTVGDVTGDGKRDLVYTQTSGDGYPYHEGYVFVARGRGDATFEAPVRYQVARGAWKVVIGDFTRDGIIDIVTANRSSIYIDDCGGDTRKTWDTLSLLAGTGNGAFAAPYHFSIGNQLTVESERDRNVVSSLNTSDVNGDGATDLITSGGTVFLNQPSDANVAPTVDLGPDQTYYGSFEIVLAARANDADQDVLTYSWTMDRPGALPPIPSPCINLGYGTYHFTVTVDDGHGHQATDSIALTFIDPNATVTIQAPQANAVLPAGQPYTFKWHLYNPTGAATTTQVDFSSDGGQTFSPAGGSCQAIPVGTNVDQDFTCTWSSPGPATTNGRIYITAADRNGQYVTGNAVPVTVSDQGGFPPPWHHQDIGAVGAAGSASFSNGVFTVTGSGADIWGTADEFHYVARPNPSSTGNVELITRVDSVQNVNAWTKAGLMLRTTMAADAVHASLFVSPGKGIAFQRRVSAGGTSVHTAGPMLTAPVWLRLTARGGVACTSVCGPITVVRAYYRKNASDAWTFIGEQRFTGTQDQFANVGLTVGSHVDGTTATARFSSVTMRAALEWSATAVSTSDSSVTINDDSWSIRARGADIWGTTDQFLYEHTWTPSSAVTARVKSITNPDAWAKAGVMFRTSPTPESPHVMVVVTPGKGVAMQYRPSTGAASAQVKQVTGVTAPQWVRLTRNGDAYTGSYSADGRTWITLGTVTIRLGTPAAGVAVTSHTTAAAATAVFELVTAEP